MKLTANLLQFALPHPEHLYRAFMTNELPKRASGEEEPKNCMVDFYTVQSKNTIKLKLHIIQMSYFIENFSSVF